MMQKFTLILFLFIPILLNGQDETTAKVDVINTIKALFDGMREGDSSKVSAVFHPEARLQSVFKDKEGKPKLGGGEIQQFLNQIGTPHEEIYDEKIWSYAVQVDGDMASAWTEYSFYLGDKLSHCGVNTFHLFHNGSNWQITQITDTRRRTDCQTTASAPIDQIDTLLNQWHRAAATADEEVYFGSMTPQGVFLGTDETERWLREEFRSWSKTYFDRESAWDFTPYDRYTILAEDHSMAWFDEKLKTWMGVCRGSGVLIRTQAGWKIAHYNLAVTIPNEKIDGFIELVGAQGRKK